MYGLGFPDMHGLLLTNISSLLLIPGTVFLNQTLYCRCLRTEYVYPQVSAIWSRAIDHLSWALLVLSSMILSRATSCWRFSSCLRNETGTKPVSFRRYYDQSLADFLKLVHHVRNLGFSIKRIFQSFDLASENSVLNHEITLRNFDTP